MEASLKFSFPPKSRHIISDLAQDAVRDWGRILWRDSWADCRKIAKYRNTKIKKNKEIYISKEYKCERELVCPLKAFPGHTRSSSSCRTWHKKTMDWPAPSIETEIGGRDREGRTKAQNNGRIEWPGPGHQVPGPWKVLIPVHGVPGKISREMQMRAETLTIVQLILGQGVAKVAKEVHCYLICIPSIGIWILDCPVSSFLKRTYKDIKNWLALCRLLSL